MRIRALLLGLIMTLPILQQPQLFRFEDNFWINLHHFLYGLGRAKASAPDSQRRAVVEAPREVASASLSEADRNTWNDAVMFYERTLSKQDAVFDNQLVSITNALSHSNGASSANNGLDLELRNMLESAAPVYRKYWYPQHAASNARAVRALNDLLERYGNGVMRRITKAYGQGWPSGGVLVQISGYSNWAGAYSTNGPLLVVSSTDSACGIVGRSGEGHLRGMAVDRGWHGHGIAQRLLERAEAELRNVSCTHITLDTTEYLKRAIRFYERNGYKPSGKVSDFFGMPLYEYQKPLE